MKGKLLILIITLFFLSCNNNEKRISIENEIKTLQEEYDSLKSLQKIIEDSLNVSVIEDL